MNVMSCTGRGIYLLSHRRYCFLQMILTEEIERNIQKLFPRQFWRDFVRCWLFTFTLGLSCPASLTRGFAETEMQTGYWHWLVEVNWGTSTEPISQHLAYVALYLQNLKGQGQKPTATGFWIFTVSITIWKEKVESFFFTKILCPYLVAQMVKNPPAMPETQVPLEKGMATHSSILAWRIP